MDRLNTTIKAVITCFGIAFFALIIYVSILGDNHKINYLVDTFFSQIKDRQYSSVCGTVDSVLPYGDLRSNDHCMNFCFLLELSLLTHFNKLDSDGYSIEITRSHFWIPYITDDTVMISIAVTPKKENLFQEFFNSTAPDAFIKNFMAVERASGGWKIKRINLQDTELSGTFKTLMSSIDLEKYITKTPEGFLLKKNEINGDSLSEIEKRLLEFSIFKLARTGN